MNDMIFAARWFTFAVVALSTSIFMEPIYYTFTLLFTLVYGILCGITGWQKCEQSISSMFHSEE